MGDIDQTALEIAGRFTLDSMPEARKQLAAELAAAIRAAQPEFPLVELLDIRNQLHVMATTVVPNFCDLAAGLQGQVQRLIDAHRKLYPEGDRG